MKFLFALAALAVASVSFASDSEDTMCVKQKDGTYYCKASGKFEKEPCCAVPSNPPAKPAPTPTPRARP
ncbi:MAG TPA: hypothetical protein VM940_06135 [Chthoniobacterales bacterium]|nr:hypothetical protein [Chthoniobacterales bacterium]